jgi:hypothetical protein
MPSVALWVLQVCVSAHAVPSSCGQHLLTGHILLDRALAVCCGCASQATRHFIYCHSVHLCLAKSNRTQHTPGRRMALSSLLHATSNPWISRTGRVNSTHAVQQQRYNHHTTAPRGVPPILCRAASTQSPGIVLEKVISHTAEVHCGCG